MFSIWRNPSGSRIGLQEHHDPATPRMVQASQVTAGGTGGAVPQFIRSTCQQQQRPMVGRRSQRGWIWESGHLPSVPRNMMQTQIPLGHSPTLVFTALCCQQKFLIVFTFLPCRMRAETRPYGQLPANRAGVFKLQVAAY